MCLRNLPTQTATTALVNCFSTPPRPQMEVFSGFERKLLQLTSGARVPGRPSPPCQPGRARATGSGAVRRAPRERWTPTGTRWSQPPRTGPSGRQPPSSTCTSNPSQCVNSIFSPLLEPARQIHLSVLIVFSAHFFKMYDVKSTAVCW